MVVTAVEESSTHGLEYGSVLESCSSQEEASNMFIEWHKIFIPGTMKIDKRYTNCWLENVPNLSEECSQTKVADLLGNKVKIGNEEFSTELLSLADASRLLVPRKFGEAFPLQNSGTGVSRILLRQDLIRLWNGWMDRFDPSTEFRCSDFNILSAASGLGKSVYLYLVAVFARHFQIPVQYVANSTFLLEGLPDEHTVARKYAAMLLFMNASILDNMGTFCSGFLNGVPMKLVVFFVLQKGDVDLCMELRRKILNMRRGKLFIMDEHHTLWQQFGDNINSWPSFFRFFADPWSHRINLEFISGGSQHREFIDKRPSGYLDCVQYVEPLSMKEFAIWQKLDDYPMILKENCSKLVELSGLVPSRIAEFVEMTRMFPHFSFEQLANRFYRKTAKEMKKKHNQYVKSLSGEISKATFVDMLYGLFLSNENPRRILCKGSYLDRGLLIPVNCFYLRFYNSIARDILFQTFSRFYSTLSGQVELSKMLERAQVRRGKGGCFDDVFFLWCLYECPVIELHSRSCTARIQFTTNQLWRFDGKLFDPPLKKIMDSCWVRLCKNDASLDYVYVDMSNNGWTLYLFKAAVSLFPYHNNDPTLLELLFSSEPCHLGLLLESFFDESFHVSPTFNGEGKIVDFHVTDCHGVSYRDRIRVFYVTFLTRQEAEGSNIPSFVELITFEDYPANIKFIIDEYRRGGVFFELRHRSGKRRNRS